MLMEAVWPRRIKSNAFGSQVSLVTTLNSDKIVSESIDHIFRKMKSHLLWLLLIFNLVEWANSFISNVFQTWILIAEFVVKIVCSLNRILYFQHVVNI